MITESLLIFLTSVMSLNQPANTGQQPSTAKDAHKRVVAETKTEPSSVLLRGGWDRN